jgi:beta-lactamase superfamily II metal-dependent hydrolase
MRTSLLFAVVLALGGTAAGRSQSQSVRPLDVYWIDVEGGAATLIVTPAGESVLVDAGNPGARDSGRIVRTAKDLAHLDHIDAVVVTHLHNDHFGGVAEVAAALPVRALYENGIDSAPSSERAQATVPAFRNLVAGKRVVVQPGDRLQLKQATGAAPLSLRVVAARQKVASGGPARPNAANCHDLVRKPVDTSDNANSIVMLLEFGAFRMFLGGDTTWNVEETLVCPDDRVGPVDVYQSVHHGLDLSNNPVLVRTLQPHVVVFNNGARKGYEANASKTLASTASVQAIYQMHRAVRDGAVNTADERIANHDEVCKGDGIAMTVAPDGKSYTVTVPSTGHRQTFQTR